MYDALEGGRDENRLQIGRDNRPVAVGRRSLPQAEHTKAGDSTPGTRPSIQHQFVRVQRSETTPSLVVEYPVVLGGEERLAENAPSIQAGHQTTLHDGLLDTNFFTT